MNEVNDFEGKGVSCLDLFFEGKILKIENDGVC